MHYVGYLILPPKSKIETPLFFTDHALLLLRKNLEQYLKTEENSQLLEVFIEVDTQKKNRRTWPQLEKALFRAKEGESALLIAELKNFSKNRFFSNLLLNFIQKDKGQVFFCDQRHINHHNFEAVIEHLNQQRKTHSDRIKAGLSKSSSKSGNPNASQLITTLNKPKIDNAILYALMLAPIIRSYVDKGYSQRVMVKTLNEHHFRAPEGGLWVLSQLQKMLERIHVNEKALNLAPIIHDYQAQGASLEQICHQLSLESLSSLQALIDRFQKIQEILKMNTLILEMEEKNNNDEFRFNFYSNAHQNSTTD